MKSNIISNLHIILLLISFVEGCFASQQVEAQSNSGQTKDSKYDFSIAPFELWEGTELQPIQLPELQSINISTVASLKGHEGKPDNRDVTEDLSFRESKNRSSLNSMHKSQDSQLSFAEPIDFQIWNLVKWTLVVLVIAAVAASLYRFKKRDPLNTQSLQKLKLLETINITPRIHIHLLGVGGEKYLVASDPNGVKTVTLIPNWQDVHDLNLHEEEEIVKDVTNQSIAS